MMQGEERDAEAQALSEPLLPPDSERSTDDEVTESNNDRPSISRNIPLTLVYTFVAFAGRSIWNSSVLPTFVFLLSKGSAEKVGLITAVMGLAQLLSSFPSGYLADKHRRDSLLKLASLVGVMAIAFTIYSVHREQFSILLVALAAWGVFWGIANTGLSALFADSIPDGQRSHYFTHRTILVFLGNSTGPLTALFLFRALGDKWTIADCATVMIAGQLICLPAILLLCFFSDDHAVSHHEDEQNSSRTSGLNHPLVQRLSSLDSEGQQSESSRPTNSSGCCSFLRKRFVPVMVTIADISAGLGSGMSIRYFPIFFVKYLRLNPVAVQVVYLLTPLGLAWLSKISQLLSKKIGRCKVTVCCKWIGVALMLFMVAAYKAHFPTWSICTIYVIRTCFMNGTGALTRSYLMDHVPKKERGKWSALESVNMFSWSGSAFMGGILVGYKGLIFNFCVTAGVQFLATVPLVVLSIHETLEGEPQPAENTCTTNIHRDRSTSLSEESEGEGTEDV